METSNPSYKFYGLFQYIFDYYNEGLFDGKLKDCLLVITRKKNVFGHYSYKRWYNESDKETDELALNPQMFAKFPLIEICQTMVHEMVHGWQFHCGKPSRSGYHNKQFAEKMIEVGLMPSDTGKPGGKKTGQKMADYPIEGGRFLELSKILMEDDIFSELFLEVNPQLMEMIDPDVSLFEQLSAITLAQPQGASTSTKTKIKYSCKCSNIWGKPGLSLHCNSCNEDFEEII